MELTHKKNPINHSAPKFKSEKPWDTENEQGSVP